jgi:hypothetical protein
MVQVLPRQKVCETPSIPIAGCSSMYLSFPHVKLHGRLGMGGSQFLATLDKKIHETPSQWKNAGCGNMSVIPATTGSLK